MSSPRRPSETSGFSAGVFREGQPEDLRDRPHSLTEQGQLDGDCTDELVGKSNEASITIEGQSTSALLDTGSSVSTVTQQFYETHLAHLELQQLDQLLRIECADGQHLPYQGYIQAEVEVPELGQGIKQSCLLLVVPTTTYGSSTPVLLGTNFLSALLREARAQLGDSSLQKTSVQSWYLAFRCVSVRERQLSRRCNRLAVVRSAELEKVTVMPNEKTVIQGFLSRTQPYHQTCALLQPHYQAHKDLDLEPTLISYNQGTKSVEVTVSNLTTQTVTLNPRAVLCEVQPVTITALDDVSIREQDDILSQVSIDKEYLTADEQEVVHKLVKDHEAIFSKNEEDVGLYSGVKHIIHLHNEQPFKQRHRPIPPSMLDEVRSHLQQLLASGVIRYSHSPWSSNVVLARRKDGRLRLCTDFRQLNSRTVHDAHALPRVEEILDCLAGSHYFSVLDMKSGYYQVEIEETHKERTAFTVGPLGFFEYNRLPFGLTNSPATYQRLMQDILGDYHMKICLIYLDDIIVFSRTFEEHVERLIKVFKRIEKAGLKLAPKKCRLFHERVVYVGHSVSKEGVGTDPAKIEVIRDWPTPRNADDVRRWLGFSGYYRKFVKDYAKIAAPLTALLPPTVKKKNRKKQDSAASKAWKWGQAEENAFQQLKAILMSPPVLGYADFNKPFELHTDASTQGLGAVLYQEQGGKYRVIAYASRSLGKAEKNYPAHKLEFLALKWAVCEKFKDYLYGSSFTVHTDNNPLTYVLTSAKLDATGHRWLAALSAFNFNLKYKPGRKNVDADSLSRLPHDTSIAPPMEELSQDIVYTICNAVGGPVIETLCMSAEVVDMMEDAEGHDLAEFGVKDWRRTQEQDKVLGPWMSCVRKQQKPKCTSGSAKENSMMKNFEHFKLLRGVLHRETYVDEQKKLQIVLPSSLMDQALRGLHNDIGHPGRDRTMTLVRDRFWWPGMAKQVEDWVKHCPRCLRRKAQGNTAPMVSITSSQPLELVCMDYLSIEASSGGFQSVLVITDHFTRYAVAVPTRNQTARTTAEVLFNSFIVHYGFPRRLHSDQGASFEGKVIKELCKLTNMVKSHTTTYHPMGNGMTERFNRTLLSMLGTLEKDEKRQWHKHVPALVHAYNCTTHESTGYTPYYLLFGREPRLPIDLVFGLEKGQNSKSYSSYISDLKQRLRDAYRVTTKVADKARKKQKMVYDAKIRGAVLQLGDRVLVRILAFQGKHKLSDRWAEDVYVVQSQPNPDIPVYVVCKEQDGSDQRTLHRNHLLPIGGEPVDISVSCSPDVTKRPVPKPRHHIMEKQKKKTLNRRENTTDSMLMSSDNEESNENVVILFKENNAQSSQDEEDASVAPTDRESANDNGIPSQQGDDPTTDVELGSEDVGDDDRQPFEDQDGASELQTVEVEAAQGYRRLHSETERRESQEQEMHRSSRVRKPPPWQTSGEFIMSCQSTEQEIDKTRHDCKTKLDMLSNLVASGALPVTVQTLETAFQCVLR